MATEAEKLTGKKFNQDPKFKRRRVGGVTLLAAGVIGAGVAANTAMDRVQGTGPTVENPRAEHPERHYNSYTVQGGDTLTEIVNKAYPDLDPYGVEFQEKVAALNRQLPKQSSNTRGDSPRRYGASAGCHPQI